MEKATLQLTSMEFPVAKKKKQKQISVVYRLVYGNRIDARNSFPPTSIHQYHIILLHYALILFIRCVCMCIETLILCEQHSINTDYFVSLYILLFVEFLITNWALLSLFGYNMSAPLCASDTCLHLFCQWVSTQQY